MLLQATPDTTGYMIAGYVLTFISMGVYILSISIRAANFKRDLETLKELEEEK
ncbi:MAG: hypothetical protein IT311_08610 [Anaerolineales bacterium]|nr:hypothetical protein [Anaerolineales bacterium]MCZ2120883.1 hypothetical protein [Anaerolineales bacterium]